jgi:Plasmid recombination enzyme
MNNTSTNDQTAFLLNIGAINTLKILRSAFTHNKREIQKELGARSHIDAQKIPLNYSLVDVVSTDGLIHKVNERIQAYEHNIFKRIRHDAVIAIEVLFSLPHSRPDINNRDYFRDSLAWAETQFSPAEVLTADVHLDEATPHMHVIFLCVTPTKLVASKVKGDKRKYRERKEDFFHKVAQKYGLTLPPEKLLKADRIRLAKQVISQVETSSDPMTKSPHYHLIRLRIENDPVPFAVNLGIDVKTTPKKLRTVVQIFTSKGEGSSHHPNV